MDRTRRVSCVSAHGSAGCGEKGSERQSALLGAVLVAWCSSQTRDLESWKVAYLQVTKNCVGKTHLPMGSSLQQLGDGGGDAAMFGRNTHSRVPLPR